MVKNALRKCNMEVTKCGAFYGVKTNTLVLLFPSLPFGALAVILVFFLGPTDYLKRVKHF